MMDIFAYFPDLSLDLLPKGCYLAGAPQILAHRQLQGVHPTFSFLHLLLMFLKVFRV
jgi:hypothetical protein